jgi:hypothetical protein
MKPIRWKGAKEPKLGPGKRSIIFVADMGDSFFQKHADADINSNAQPVQKIEIIGGLPDLPGTRINMPHMNGHEIQAIESVASVPQSEALDASSAVSASEVSAPSSPDLADAHHMLPRDGAVVSPGSTEP